MKCTNDVCGMRRVGGQRRKGSEWWNEEVGTVRHRVNSVMES